MLSRTVLVCFIPLCYGMVVNSADVDTHSLNLAPRWKRENHHTGDTSGSLPDDDGLPIPPSQDNVNAPGNDQIVPGNIDNRDDVLQMISKHLVILTALGREQLEKIDFLEDRYKKLEHQTKERSEIISKELHEIAQIVRGSEMTLNTVKADTFYLRQDSKRMHDDISSIGICCDNHSRSALETKSKLETMQESVHEVRSSLGSVLDQLSTIKWNITNVVDITRESLSQNKQLPTTEYLDNKIIELKNTTISAMFNTTKKLEECEETLPTNCWDVLQNGYKSSGIYTIRPPSTSANSFNVYCDMESRGGGWTVFQNRNTGELDFNKNWNEYKLGFGDLHGEFWLGLENVYQMTSHEVYEILIEMKDYDSEVTSVQYDAFVIGSEIERYPIKALGNYTGPPGENLKYHAGQKFSTKDADNDGAPNGSCAATFKGGWWYDNCSKCNFNGHYVGRNISGVNATEFGGVYWQAYRNSKWLAYSLKETRMSLRPRQRRH